MPTYEYQCKACGHALEEFHSIMDPPLTRCPRCQTDNLVRVMGTGVGLIFRGTGFYLTDYKKAGGSSAEGSSGSKGDSRTRAGKSSSQDAEGSGEKESAGDRKGSEKKESSEGKKSSSGETQHGTKSHGGPSGSKGEASDG
jgi:putative FmdB family regulatory protein